MDPTALVTFLFKAPPEVRTIELLGSWDNFQQPYHMHHDRRRGKGFWSGCFKFHNIIFDGHSCQWTKPRDGGLKQGGIYWYYYRLNDEDEVYDDSREWTSSCPLLPGQRVNIIDVPVELVDPPTRCHSADADVIGTLTSLPSSHTLDPGAKFVALDPPPVSRVHGRCISDLALSGRLENSEHLPCKPSRPSPEVPFLEQPISGSIVKQRSKRYYASGGVADDQGSICSRRSLHSRAASFAHSTVSSASNDDTCETNGSRSLLLAHSTVPPVPSRPAPLRPTRQDDFDFDLPVPDDLFETRSWCATRTTSELPSLPTRPFTSHGVLQSTGRPGLSSPAALDTHASPRSSGHDGSDFNQDGLFSLWSPAFSADTVSSRGPTTPYRLSVGNSRTASSNGDSIDGVAERLRLLGREDSEDTLPSPILEVDETVSFTEYALPQFDGMEKLDKVPSSRSDCVRDLKAPSLAIEETSFADSIFDELGFLGGSIL